jgi:hypothetical protein
LSGVVPSYAVLDGMGIVATSLAEVKAVIDAHSAGSNITKDSTYQAASSASLAHPTGIMYVNLARLVSVLEKLPSSSGMQTTATAYLAPLRAFMFTATSQTGAAVERFFVAIK